MRLKWLHLVIIGLLVVAGLNYYLHSPGGKTMLFSAYGSSLIRPNETAEVVDQLGLEISAPVSEGSFEWNEVERTYYWVCQNVSYREDGDTAVELVGQKWVLWENEHFASSATTIQEGAGDCEDMSILLCSMLIQAGVPSENVRVVLGTFSNGRGTWGHAWVELALSEGYWVILDPTQMGIRIFGTGYYKGIIWFGEGKFGYF